MLKQIIFFSLSLFLLSLCYAQTAVQENLVNTLTDVGISFEHNNSNLNILMDEDKIFLMIPRFQQLNYISKKVTESQVKTQSTTLSFQISAMLTIIAIHDTYANDPNVDKLHINVYFFSSNSNSSKELCYSFDFNRDLFNKINWSTYSSEEMMKTSPNFTISDWCKSRLSSESKKKS